MLGGCLSVDQLVCQQDYTKFTEWISTNLDGGWVKNRPDYLYVVRFE